MRRLMSQCIHATLRRFYSAKHTTAFLAQLHHSQELQTADFPGSQRPLIRYIGLGNVNAVVWRPNQPRGS